MVRLAALLGLIVVLAGCGGKQTTTTTTTEPSSSSVRVYMLREGRVAPVSRALAMTKPSPRAALEQLLQGASPADERAGLDTAVVPGNSIVSFRIVNGIARVKLALDLTQRGIAQVVYTLTQFPTIKRVAVVTPDVAPGPQTRGAFESLTPAILVEEPTPFARVTRPLRVSGTANAFEATLQLELRRDDGAVLVHRTVTASSGSGTRGSFTASLSFEPTSGKAVLDVYEESAKDGSRIHVVSIPLILSG
ncbi:MAG: Gmad2 immunoglobulin-like domain-containing protein [Gaiellaceae bacterium]